MGEITWEMRQKYGRTANWIPDDLLPQLDQDEILDRLDDAEALWAKCDQAPRDVAAGYLERARLICKAAPRDQVEAQAADWIAKAEGAYTSQHAAGCREQARRIRQDNPPATRRPRPRVATPSPEQKRHADAVALLRADVESRDFLAKVDAAPPNAPVTRKQLVAMVNRELVRVLTEPAT